MIKKIFLWLIAVVVVVSGALITYVYYNQDILKEQLIIAINERLKVPVDVQDMSIAPLSSFPNATVVFSNVKITDPHKRDAVFAEAGEIKFSFNIWQLLQGSMVLEEISYIDGNVNIIQYAPDRWSYQIYKESENASGDFKLDIKNLNLTNAKVEYASAVNITQWSGVVNHLNAALQVDGTVTLIDLKTDFLSRSLLIKDFETLQDQNIKSHAEMVIDKQWRIESDELEIGDSFFALLIARDSEGITAKISAEQADMQTLLDLSPAEVKNRLANYESSGKISLEAGIRYLFETNRTGLDGSLTFNKVDIVQKNPEIKLEGLNLEGKIQIPDFNNLKSAQVSFQNITGLMNSEPLAGALRIKNFKSPQVSASYKGIMPLRFIVDFGGLDISDPEGLLDINLELVGELADLNSKEHIKKVDASGEVVLQDLSFKIPGRPYTIQATSGNIIFNNDNLALNDLKMLLGESDFLINGILRNYWNLGIGDNWTASAELRSQSLMLDELLAAEGPSRGQESYRFSLPEKVTLNLEAVVDEFRVRRFDAKRLTGKVKIENNVLTAERLSFESMGGLVKIKGQWADLKKAGSDVDITFLLAGVNANDLFYSFENFNQDFITNENLSGKIYAEAQAGLRLDSNLVVNSKSLKSVLKTRIIDGRLKDFEPLYSLEKYFDNADLSMVEFADLENEINITDETIQLPMMAVGTNIVKFKIGGRHTFDQHIDYDVVAPLNRKKKVDKDARFGIIEEDQHGESLLFLNIVGTTEDFEVSLDKDAIKQEIAADVKKEIKELQDAFKNKGKTANSEVELAEDDYFEWDDNKN